MKPIQPIILFLLAVTFMVGGCASAPPTIISKDYELYGTWVNPEYETDLAWYAKVLYHPDGRVEFYDQISDFEAAIIGDFVITSKWIDRDDRHWYTAIIVVARNQWRYTLGMIESTGLAMHTTAKDTDYPTELDLDLPTRNPGYMFYMRQ